MNGRLGGSIVAALACLAATTAFGADATAVAKAHSEAFARACAAGDIPAVLALYEDGAVAVWPGQGEEAKGKPAIEKLAKNLCGPPSPDKPSLVLKSVEGRALGKGYIVTNGRWEMTTKEASGASSATVIRTTEVLHETSGKWRYVTDHASIGVPPPAAAAKQ